MSFNIFDLLNHEVSPFGVDAPHTRMLIALIVAGAAFHWVKSCRENWVHVWTRRERRVITWMIAVIAVNALLLLSAAQRDDPIRVGTWTLAGVFVGLNIAMLIRFSNDDTHERQYERLFRRPLR